MVLSDSAEVMETVAKERFLRKSPFLEFCDAEGLPVITGYGVEDLRTSRSATGSALAVRPPTATSRARRDSSAPWWGRFRQGKI